MILTAALQDCCNFELNSTNTTGALQVWAMSNVPCQLHRISNVGFQEQLAFEGQYGNPCLAHLHLANTFLIVEYL
jgi:hypothetical protein